MVDRQFATLVAHQSPLGKLHRNAEAQVPPLEIGSGISLESQTKPGITRC